ncbi:MAG: response regulator [Chloroflexi bacterium]|nr:response regulator [Chloroflexota bacterium]
MSKKIRILVVDDVPESRDSIGKLLRFEADMEVAGVAGEGREAVQKVHQLHPDIVLMDINMPDMDGITAAGLITQQAPNSAVIMMSVQNEADYLRRSMQAGAREFLVKPFSLDDLVRSIREVNESRRPVVVATPTHTLADTNAAGGERGKVICAFSPKGGAGRSTLLANLAVAAKLATKKRVALFDADLVFGDLAVLLNLPVTRTITDLVTNIRQLDDDLLADVMVAHSSGVKVLLAPASPQQAEKVTAEHVRLVLQMMVNSFDYIFVDLSPSFAETNLALMDMADRILLVLLSELTSLKNARLFLEVTELLGYERAKVSFVLNRATAPSAISVAAISENLHRAIEVQIADDARTVIKSTNDGVPFVISTPEARVSRDIGALLHLIEPQSAADPAEPAAVEGTRPVLRKLLTSLSRGR